MSLRVLTSMSDSIDTAGGTHSRRQGHCQVDIINDSPRQDLRIRASLLQPIGSFTQDGGHFTTGVSCRNADMWQPSTNANRLSKADGTSTSNGDDRVGSLRLSIFESLVGDIRRRVHGGLAEDASDLTFKHILDGFRVAELIGRGQHQRGLHLQTGDLIREFLQCAAAETTRPGLGLYSKASIFVFLF